MIDSPATSRYLRRPGLLSGGGGLVSTASDYARFCLALRGRGAWGETRLLRAGTVAEMTGNQLPAALMPIKLGPVAWKGVGFGLGFSVRVEAIPGLPASSVGEYGWAGAASTTFWVAPRADVFTILMVQRMPMWFAMDYEVRPLVYAALAD